MIYSIFCILNGKTISTAHGDYADDKAAIEKARFYFRSSAADTVRVHRDAPFYPLGALIAELTTDWTVWQLGPDSDPQERWIITTQDGISALLGHRYPTSWTKHERARLAGSPLCL